MEPGEEKEVTPNPEKVTGEVPSDWKANIIAFACPTAPLPQPTWPVSCDYHILRASK